MNKNIINKIIYTLLGMCLLSIFIVAFFFSKNWQDYTGNSTYLLSFLYRFAAAGIILWSLYLLCRSTFFEKFKNKITLALLVTAFFVQVIFVVVAHRYVYTDTGYVSVMAGRLMDHNFNWLNYFSVYPNNVNITLFFAVILTPIKLLGLHSFYGIIPWIQLLCLDLSLLYFVNALMKIKRIYGLAYISLFVVYFPIFSYLIFPYNDLFALSLTMVVMTSILKLSRENVNKRSFALQSIVLTASLGLSVAIRQNALILLIAMTLSYVLFVRLSLKQKIVLAMSTIILVIVCSLGFQLSAQKQGYEMNQANRLPMISWITMSWHPETSGEFVPSDFFETMNTPSAERTPLMKAELKTRIHTLGIKGTAKHLVKKIQYMFSTGASNVDIWPLLVDLPSNSADKTKKMVNLAINWFQPFYIVIVLLSILGIKEVLSNKVKDNELINLGIFSALSILGIFSFHIFLWEVRDRYAIQLLPFLFLFTIFGLHAFYRKARSIKIPENRGRKLLIPVFLFVLLTSSMVLNFQQASRQSIVTSTVYQSGFPVYTEKESFFKKLDSQTRYETDDFQIKQNANQLFMPIGDLLQDSNGLISINVLKVNNGRAEKISINQNQQQFTGDFEKGTYRIVIMNNSDKPLSSQLLERMGTKNLQGPKVYENNVLLNDVSLQFTFNHVSRQPLISHSIIMAIYAFFLALLIFNMIQTRNLLKLTY